MRRFVWGAATIIVIGIAASFTHGVSERPAANSLAAADVERGVGDVLFFPDSIVTNCCGSVPAALTAKLTTSGACTGINGATVTLNHAAGKWSGTTNNLCAGTLTVSLECKNVTPFGWSWVLNAKLDGPCSFEVKDVRTNLFNTCSPFKVGYGPIGVTDGANCTCCTAYDSSLMITITP